MESTLKLNPKSLCYICLTPDSEGCCGLLRVNTKIELHLSEIFDVEVYDKNIARVCLPCINGIDEAANFKEMAKKNHDILNFSKNNEFSTRECSVSIVPIKIEQTSDEECESVSKISFNLASQRPKRQSSIKARAALKEDIIEEARPDDDFSSSDFDSFIKVVEVKDTKNANNGSVYKCDLCQRLYNQKFSLQKHMIKHHIGKPEGYVYPPPKKIKRRYECNLCRKTFTARHSVAKHKRVMHDNDDQDLFHKCQICSRVFSEKKILKRHLTTEHVKKPLLQKQYNPQCIDGVWHCCGKTYAKRSNFLEHKGTMHRDMLKKLTPYCTICGKQFKSMTIFAKHRTEAHKDGFRPLPKEDFNPKKGPNNTTICCGHAMPEMTFYQHKRKMHPEHFLKNTMFCHICGEKVIGLKALQQHRRENHQPGQPLVLSKYRLNYKPKRVKGGNWNCCGETFRSREWNTHRVKVHPEHVAKITVNCYACFKKFESNGDLKRHQKTEHPNYVRTNVCNICDIATSSISYHMKSHHPAVFKNKKKLVLSKSLIDTMT